MSLKNGKRSRRKTDDEIAQELKSNKSEVKSIETSKMDSQEELKGFESENSENLVESQEKDEGRITRSRSNTPQKKPEMKLEAEIGNESVPKEPDEVLVSEISEDITTNKIIIEKEVEETVEVQNGENNAVPDTNGVKESEEIEMEPLVLESEDIDPELQFDEISDESRRSSPVLSRCKTRRSQTRNIPTPKTPNPLTEQNAEDKQPDKIPITSNLTEPEEKQSPDPITIDLNETRDSFESAISTKVNVGSDVTRETDLTLPDEKESSFLKSAKEMTVAESFRKLSSRKTIRSVGDYRRNVLRSTVEKRDFQINRSSVEKIVGQKRKERSETPDGVKRFKPETSSATGGFFSYISSPIYKLKNRLSPVGVSASTPKLMSYRKQDILEDAEFSKIEGDSDPQPEKKWCSIM